MSRTIHKRVLLRRPAKGDADSGAVAIMVALLISTVLLVVGALTVDLGSAWAERVGLRSVAESAALAGAAVLPWNPSPGALDPELETSVVDEAVRVLCADGNRRPSWDSTACTGSPGWAQNDSLADGEVVVSRAETGLFDVGLDQRPWVVRVVTPPVTVQFGLARAFGETSTDVRASAGARPGLPYPVDKPITVSPYYLTLDDLRNGPDPSGWTCLRTRTLPPVAADPPEDPDGVDSSYVVGTLDQAEIAAAPVVLTLTGASFGDSVPVPPDATPIIPSPVRVFVGDGARAAEASEALVLDVSYRSDTSPPGYQIRFEAPEGIFGPQKVWFVYSDTSVTPPEPRISTATDLLYPPNPDPGPDVERTTFSSDCDGGYEGRGLVLPPEGTVRPPNEVLADGLTTRLRPFGGWPQAQDLPGPSTDCTDPVDVAPAVAVPDAVNLVVDDANCVPVVDGDSVSAADATLAWFGTPETGDPQGRLQSICTGTGAEIDGRGSERFDQTSLFDRRSRRNGLVSRSVSTFDLRERISDGLPADAEFRGAILRKVFDCPRLLLVPVLDVTRPVDTDKHAAVVGLTYFYAWDFDSHERDRPYRGLITDDSDQVIGIRGWVIDPGYLEGADWVRRSSADPDADLPMSTPERSVLVRTPCDDHPESTPCPP